MCTHEFSPSHVCVPGSIPIPMYFVIVEVKLEGECLGKRGRER